MYKITVKFDSSHICSVWCDGYTISEDAISAWSGSAHNIIFVMFCDNNDRTYKIYQGDKLIEHNMSSANLS